MTDKTHPPRTIYLQWHHPDSMGGNEFVTWSLDKQHDDDVQYTIESYVDEVVRKDLRNIIAFTDKRNEVLRDKLAWAADALLKRVGGAPPTNEETKRIIEFHATWRDKSNG
jgi:hypothetical protein